ncbi:MAG: hypothetical protein ABSG17_14825 [Spirochaetia bacterium]
MSTAQALTMVAIMGPSCSGFPQKKQRRVGLPRAEKASILVPAMKLTGALVASILFLGALVRLSAGQEDATPEAGSAQNLPASGDFDPTQYIGLDLKSALETLGTPQEVFSLRGPDENQDDVVFYYPDFLYLFWYRNRVWQVRCDRRFARPLLGVALGMPREVIQRTSPHQLIANGDSLYFDMDDGKYPLRVRMVFANDALSDIYVYRSDF